MATHVTTRSGEGYKVHADNGQSGVVLDMAVKDGGSGAGMEPHEMLLSALGGCTSMTVLSYAKRKAWPLEGVDLDLTHEGPPVAGGGAPGRITVGIRFRGPLDETQRTRLMEIATKCPVYKTLTGDLEIVETQSAEPKA